ncbi:MAG: type II toxin-antitoxin system PemK/MazF family toxin [Bryobacteraceae bacterium]|nr:type II toxin-antitoxin system PemK/MazF family toxin [Bryobacteraceae bacterium]
MGDYGKPRPAVVVQADIFNETHASVVVCPITSDLMDAEFLRPTLEPSKSNGLKKTSQVMIDKITAVRRDRIAKPIGRVTGAELIRINRALRTWLDLDLVH